MPGSIAMAVTNSVVLPATSSPRPVSEKFVNPPSLKNSGERTSVFAVAPWMPPIWMLGA